MRYADPQMFFLVLPWALACLIVALNQKIALDWLNANVSQRFLPGFTRYTPGKLAFHALLIFCAGFSLIWSLALPYRRGEVAEETAGKDVHLMIDASYSMYAQDTSAVSEPEFAGKTRFEAAKALAADLAEELKNGQVGVTTFSGSSITHFMPTADTVTAAILIANLNIHSMRHTGSDFPALLNAFVHAVEQGGSDAIGVILSDGEPVPENQDIARQLDALGAAGIPVFTVGFGTDTGSKVDLYEPEDVFNRADSPRIAKTISTRRDSEFLRKIASSTGGRYFEPENGLWATEIARAVNAFPTEDQTLPGELKMGNVDLSAWGIFFFLAFFFAELAWLFPRSVKPIPHPGLRTVAAIAFLLTFPRCGNRLFEAHRENEAGIGKYQESLFEPANSHFELSALYRTEADIPLFNLGNNALQKKEYGKAHSYYQQSIHADPGAPDAYFNDGVALFLWAEDEIDPKGCYLAKSAELFDQSIARFEESKNQGMNAQPNIDYVKKRIRDIYELHYSAKGCGQNANQKTYTSKHAPPPPQKQQQQQQQQQQNQEPSQNQQQQNQQQNQEPSQNQQQQNQQQNQEPSQNQQQQNQQQNQEPSRNQQQQNQASSQNQIGNDSKMTEEERLEIANNIERIKKENGSSTDFKQTEDQQTPTEKSEVDADLYW